MRIKAPVRVRLGGTDDAGWEPAGTAGWQTQTAFCARLGGGVHRTGSGRMGHIVARPNSSTLPTEASYVRAADPAPDQRDNYLDSAPHRHC